jgi:hypothetical protein
MQNEIKSEFYMHGVDAVEKYGKRTQSGVSKEWDFRAKEVKLKEGVKATVNLEDAIYSMYQRYTRTTFGYTKTYPEDFSPTEADDTIDRLLNVLKELPPDSLSEYAWNKIAKSLVRNDPVELKELLDKMEKDFSKKEIVPTIPEGGAKPGAGADTTFQGQGEGVVPE